MKRQPLTNLGFGDAICGQLNVREVTLAKSISREIVRPDAFQNEVVRVAHNTKYSSPQLACKVAHL